MGGVNGSFFVWARAAGGYTHLGNRHVFGVVPLCGGTLGLVFFVGHLGTFVPVDGVNVATLVTWFKQVVTFRRFTRVVYYFFHARVVAVQTSISMVNFGVGVSFVGGRVGVGGLGEIFLDGFDRNVVLVVVPEVVAQRFGRGQDCSIFATGLGRLFRVRRVLITSKV